MKSSETEFRETCVDGRGGSEQAGARSIGAGPSPDRPVAKPLQGIRVLDLTHALSGPTCTNMLSLLGADVVKVERPSVGDDFRHYTEHAGLPGMSIPFAGANNGKRSITLDLKSAEARAVLGKLVSRSDVLVENYRPGVAHKLGIDWPSLRAIKPSLIYASISGFGQTGRLRDWTAYDHIVQAMSGIMWMNGEPDTDPMKVGFPIIDTFTGYMAVIGILSALHRRHQTGEGEYIDVAMLDSAFCLMGGAIPTYFYTKEVRGRTGNRGYRLVATSETYQTQDGYLAIGANHQHQIEALCEILGCRWLLEDTRFATHRARVQNHKELRAALTEVFAHVNGEEVEARLAERHVPVAFVRNLAQILAHPHLHEREVFLESEIPAANESIRIVGPGFQLGSGRLNPGPVPALGEHTDEVLESLGFEADAIASMRKKGVV